MRRARKIAFSATLPDAVSPCGRCGRGTPDRAPLRSLPSPVPRFTGDGGAEIDTRPLIILRRLPDGRLWDEVAQAWYEPRFARDLIPWLERLGARVEVVEAAP